MDRRRLLVGAAVALLGATAQSAPRTIKVEARKFAFIPATITLKRGEPVVLELTAPEVVMGLYAPDLKLRAMIIPGQVAKVPFTPDKAGTFPFICDVFCGDGHDSMGGTIVVT